MREQKWNLGRFIGRSSALLLLFALLFLPSGNGTNTLGCFDRSANWVFGYRRKYARSVRPLSP